jgi:hypothetical protein
MKDLYTYTFRELVRTAARATGSSILSSWTDYRNRNGCDEERIVTFHVSDNDRVMDKLGKLMELAGINAQSQGLRMTDSGYLKCNCVKPTLVKFN